jgi:hypothetical protein
MTEVERLLHDAEQKLAGVDIAIMMRDYTYAEAAKITAKRYVAEALALDSTRQDPAWAESDDLADLIDEVERTAPRV